MAECFSWARDGSPRMVVPGLRLFTLCAAILQLLVAAFILRREAGPFRWACAALLAFNGLAAARLALLADLVGHLRLLAFVDGATGPLLLAAGLLLVRFPDHDLRDPRGWWTLAFAGGLVGALGLQVALSGDPFSDPLYDWLHTFPALLGLALAGISLGMTLRRVRADHWTEAGLLALAFVATLGGNAAAAADQLRYASDFARPGRLAGQALALAGGVATLALLAWPSGKARGWRHLGLAAMASGIAAYLAFFGQVGTNFFIVYLGTTMSFYVLRPVAIGLAYARSKTLWALHDLAWFALLLVLGKAIAVALLGTSTTRIEVVDLSCIAATMLLLPVGTAGVRHLVGSGRESSRRDGPAAHERLGRFLMDLREAQGPEASASKADIERVTGITENNLAAAIRRLERDLDGAAVKGTLVEERLVGVRGRKRYRLTPAGARAFAGSDDAPRLDPGAGPSFT